MSVVEAPALVLHSLVIPSQGESDPIQPSTSNIWVKVPTGVEYLGVPPVVVESSPVPYNSTAAPSWFDPNKPDVGLLFSSLLPTNKPEVYNQYIAAGVKALSPINEISTINIVLKVYPVIGYSVNDIIPKYFDVDLVLRSRVEAPYTLEASGASFSYSGIDINFNLDRGLTAAVGEFNLNTIPAEWYYPKRSMQAGTGLFKFIWPIISNFHFDEYPPYDSVSSTDPQIIPADSGGGEAVVEYNKNISFDGTYSTSVPYDRDSPKFGINSAFGRDSLINLRYAFTGDPIGLGDYTVDMWIKFVLSTATSAECIFLLGYGFEKRPNGTDSSRLYTTGIWRTGNTLSFYGYIPETNGVGFLKDAETSLFASNTTWQHIALERWNGETRMYINGQADQTPYTEIVHDLWSQQHQLFSRAEGSRCQAYIDEFRFVRFAAYKGQSFTPPTAPYDYGTNLIYLTAPTVITAAPGSFALTGQAINIDIYTTLTAVSGSFVSSGVDATLERSDPRLAGYTATYTLVGNSANTIYSRVVSAAGYAFAFTGQAASLVLAKIITVLTGTFNVTGQDAAFKRPLRVITAAAGTFSVGGQTAQFVYERSISTSTGTYTLTGNPATFIVQRIFSVNTGSFTLTGQNATFQYNRAGLPLWVEQNYSLYAEITKPSQVFD